MDSNIETRVRQECVDIRGESLERRRLGVGTWGNLYMDEWM